ncbi:MAG: glycoside hydrolase domain-containing protein, partial [Candidatus Aminicenantaceae bacterium]
MEKFILSRKLFVSSAILVSVIFSSVYSVYAKEIPYGTGSWQSDSFGNHRAVIRVSEKADAVWIHIPWRRRDHNPEKKNIIIIEAKTGAHVKNISRIKINREFGDLVFQPLSVPGEYYVYYMPYIMSGRNYPKVNYQEHASTADSAWLQRNGLTSGRLALLKKDNFPQAQVVEIQSIDEFNSFYPMEVIATAEETKRLLERNPQSPYLLFPEDRKYPIRMTENLPFLWIKKGPQSVFRG